MAFIYIYIFFFNELCRLDLPRFVFLCTNLKFPTGSRRLSGSHHIAVLLETKCLPLQPHTIGTQPRAFLWKNCRNLYFPSGDALVLVPAGAGSWSRQRWGSCRINPALAQRFFSLLCCCLCVCLCPSVQSLTSYSCSVALFH